MNPQVVVCPKLWIRLRARGVSESRKACYRKLLHYKYQLMYDLTISINTSPVVDVETQFLQLSQAGILTIKAGYAWDGPSGPAIDTATFMRASLVHDALYQLMRLDHLDHRNSRKQADDLLKTMCIADGMWRIRAWYVYLAIRLFGARSAVPVACSPYQIKCVP